MSEYVDYHMGDYLGEYILDIRDDDSGLIKEKIVRCRDCKHYTEDDMEYYHYCGNWCGQVEPDGFCKWGERKHD